MKAREFQIGDWAIHDYYKTPIQIKAIPNAEQIYHPIPLTEKILEKNGFNPTLLNGEDAPIAKVYPLKSIVGGYRFENFFPTSIHICMNLMFIHELQHALRLCGLNDLADNFQI